MLRAIANARRWTLTLTDETLGGTTTFTYEPTFNQVTSITDPQNDPTTFAYDERGNLLTSLSPQGRTITTTYNAQGLPTATRG